MNETCITLEGEMSAGSASVHGAVSPVRGAIRQPEFERIETGMGKDMDRLLASAGTPCMLFGTEPGKKEEQPLSLSFFWRDKEKSIQAVDLHIKENSELTVIMDYRSERGSGTAAVQTKIIAEKNAKLRLIQVERLDKGFACLSDIGAYCEENAEIELVQLVLGAGDVWMGCRTELAGRESCLQADIGYRTEGANRLDMNYAAVHTGKKTVSSIHAAGVLRDRAKKLFRGTIDFKKGAAGAKGDETEDVLLLDDSVQNQTIPLILCAEEDVEGNHGATIGNLDEELIFYLKSRGITQEAAYELMAAAKLGAVCRKIPDKKIQEELEMPDLADSEDFGREQFA